MTVSCGTPNIRRRIAAAKPVRSLPAAQWNRMGFPLEDINSLINCCISGVNFVASSTLVWIMYWAGLIFRRTFTKSLPKVLCQSFVLPSRIGISTLRPLISCGSRSGSLSISCFARKSMTRFKPSVERYLRSEFVNLFRPSER